MGLELILGLVLGIVAGTGVTVIVLTLTGKSVLSQARREAAKSISDAEREAATIEKEAHTTAKEYRIQQREELEKEAKEARLELVKLEQRILQKEENVDRRLEAAEKKMAQAQAKEEDTAKREKELDKKRGELEQIIEQQKERLEAVSGMTVEEAKREMAQTLENEVKRETAVRLKKVEDEMAETVTKKAQWVLASTVQRIASDYVTERSVSVVNLPNDEMKGRIIGREGRNIRAIEAATGINVIIDDTPEAIILSGFDPIRREIARVVLTRLIEDGRIHPGRVEELCEKVAAEMEESIKEAGEAACHEVNIYGLHPELVRMVGRLKYRTSYGQNVLRHTVEVVFMASIMADELGLDVENAKRGALLHDIGKTVAHEMEGTHALIGAQMCKKHGENDVVVNAVGAHHNEMDMLYAESVIVQTADALSAARPGARREQLDNYIKRLEDLEKIARDFQGVQKAYALQAGRDLRVVVKPERVSDAEAAMIARDIARRIENEMTYPGEIKVTVLRETRAVETAT